MSTYLHIPEKHYTGWKATGIFIWIVWCWFWGAVGPICWIGWLLF